MSAPAEKYAAAASEKGSRKDGRKSWDELRPIFLKSSFLSSAAGSGYFEAGGTKVFCGVHGPRAWASSSIDGVVQCEVRWAHFSGRQDVAGGTGSNDGAGLSDEEREVSAALARTLSAAVRLEMYPKSRIEVNAVVVEDDGSAFGGVVTAAGLALADAGIEMYDLVGGMGAAVVDGGKVALDAAREEETGADGTVMVGYMGKTGRVTDVMQTGEMEVGVLWEAVKTGCGGAGQVCGLVRACLEKQAGKVKKKRGRGG